MRSVIPPTTRSPSTRNAGASYMWESSCARTWWQPLSDRASGRNDWRAHSFQLPAVEIPGANSTRLRADLPVGPTNSDDSESERPLHPGGRSGACGSHDDASLGAVDAVSGRIRKLVH